MHILYNVCTENVPLMTLNGWITTVKGPQLQLDVTQD